ncbi:MAG TPA: hypothetical protein VFY90_12320, partial [Tepidiformaceae bacterium]|nr:hypothetical protein [Tepidiformaceae bacterium]
LFTGPFLAFLLLPELRSRRWREENNRKRDEAGARAARGDSAWRITWGTVTEATADMSFARKMFALASVVFSLMMSVLYFAQLVQKGL